MKSPFSNFEPTEIYQRLVELGDEFADKNAAAEILEETKHSVLSEFSATAGLGSVAANEAFAKRHPDYRAHLEKMVEARKQANKAKVKWDSAKVWVELKRTEAANERATMRQAI